MKFAQTGMKIEKLCKDVLEPFIGRENIECILADGEFYNWELVKWIDSYEKNFIIRVRIGRTKRILINKYQDNLIMPNNGIIIDYTMKKRSIKTKFPVKMLLWRENDEIFMFVFPRDSKFSPFAIRDLYRKRFMIETYYRMMYRFQAFSCSRHPFVRFIFVIIVFWLCNF